MSICPVCKDKKFMLSQMEYGGPIMMVEEPLYQISYPGQKEYVSQRCSSCIDKVLLKREQKAKHIDTH